VGSYFFAEEGPERPSKGLSRSIGGSLLLRGLGGPGSGAKKDSKQNQSVFLQTQMKLLAVLS